MVNREPVAVREVGRLVRRVAQKERLLDKRLRAAANLAHERAQAIAARRRIERSLVELREYLLARGQKATFVDVMDGLDLAIAGRRMPLYWGLAIENAKRERRARSRVAGPQVEEAEG